MKFIYCAFLYAHSAIKYWKTFGRFKKWWEIIWRTVIVCDVIKHVISYIYRLHTSFRNNYWENSSLQFTSHTRNEYAILCEKMLLLYYSTFIIFYYVIFSRLNDITTEISLVSTEIESDSESVCEETRLLTITKLMKTLYDYFDSMTPFFYEIFMTEETDWYLQIYCYCSKKKFIL